MTVSADFVGDAGAGTGAEEDAPVGVEAVSVGVSGEEVVSEVVVGDIGAGTAGIVDVEPFAVGEAVAVGETGEGRTGIV